MANDSREFRVGCIFANEKAHAVEITNGCHILVTTPKSLLRMLDPNNNITSFERCQHLVFERADGCFEKFHDQVKEIMKIYLKLSNGNPTQIIVSSDEWSEAVKGFVQAYLLRSEYVGPYFVLGKFTIDLRVQLGIFRNIGKFLDLYFKSQKTLIAPITLNTELESPRQEVHMSRLLSQLCHNFDLI